MNVLYISYDGALDPLGSSQIIPYLMHLSQKGIKFTLLTYEKRERLNDVNMLRAVKKRLEGANIKWEIMDYHKAPAIPATAFDIVAGIIKVFVLSFKERIHLIHARSFIGAFPALLLARLARIKFIFDMRGFWPDERVDGHIWRNKGLLYKAAKWCERIFMLNADRIICLTEEAKKITENFPYLSKKKISIDVIPTCVDTARFNIKDKDKALLRKLNLEDRFIFIYFGSFGTWYLLDRMIDCFKVAKQIKPNSFFLVLTPDKNFVIDKMVKNKISQCDYFSDFIPHEEISSWISLADASLFLIKPTYSKKSSCPTKFAESLACGLPVIVNSGIGDIDQFVNNYDIGVVVKRFTSEEYMRALTQLFKILDDNSNISTSCRRVAEDFFSLRSGVNKYWNIYQQVNRI